MSGGDKRKVFSDNFQIEGMGIRRQMRGYLRTRVIRFGNYGDGAGLRYFIKFAATHWFGYAISYFSLRFEPLYIKLRQRLFSLWHR